MCRICTQVTPGEPQVVLGVDKAFTFDYVYDTNSKQSEIYETCVHSLVEGSLKGYNATILGEKFFSYISLKFYIVFDYFTAYGQTGSGKTYTMGTGFERDIPEELVGIIPRAVRHLFEGIERSQLNDATQFSVGVQFMELYNEDINDLLDPFSKGKTFKIHEDTSGGISIHGATIKSITGPQDALRCLQQGALARTTASTNMNEQSSRSHAVFTILVRRQRVMSVEETDAPDGDLETLTSKFHFVDLAGSERLKRTGATGERAREGISINCGLLALGNVISALGDKSKKVSHIPYRDSKLTRLLQDSLGGNSQTVMIACVSPSDRDFMETLNTLKYANRARNIKNKVQINQDQSSRTIASLRREIAALQLELLEYKQGKRMADPAGNSNISDTFLENEMLLADNKRLHQRLKAMQETVNCLTDKNAGLLAQKQLSSWAGADQPEDAMTQVVAGYLSEIEKLKARLIESEQMYQQLKKQAMNPVMKTSTMSFITEEPKPVIELAKKELEKEREILMSRSLPGLSEDGSSNVVAPESASDSEDSDSEDKAQELQAEIADITSDIEIKSKLIEQLELSQQRMMVMKQHYEEKLTVLNNKIMNTQKERDQVLANMGGNIHTGSDQVKKVRDEYEKKISGMQKELRKLQSAQKEHLRQQRELQAQEAQMRSLRAELSDLKSMKIRLMKEMQKESNRHKEEENRKVREIAQLRKEARKQSSLIKSLQAQGAAKDQVLRRKTEEVSALRKSQRGKLSQKAAGRISPSSTSGGTPSIYNARHTKLKWDNLQRTIYRAARNKQAVMELARELERLIEEREALGRDLASVKRRKRINETPDLISEEDTINSNLNYIQENISQIQSSIMELEEGKESVNEQAMLQNAIDSVRSVDEAKFLLERLCTTSIAQVCDYGLTQIRLKEREALLNEVQQDSNIQQQLLAHVLQNSTNASMGTSGAGEGLIEMDNISLLMTNSTGTLKDNGIGSFLSDSISGRLPGDESRSSRSPSPNPSET